MIQQCARWIADHRRGLILWFGRMFSLAFTVALIADMLSDGTMSREIRQVTIAVTGFVFALVFFWQTRIAYRYEGVPMVPVPFRWVVAVWFGSMFLFVAWNVLIAWWADAYNDYRSSVIWWQFVMSTMWFCARWITADEKHTAGQGETGGS